jgi:hypothetical protein
MTTNLKPMSISDFRSFLQKCVSTPADEVTSDEADLSFLSRLKNVDERHLQGLSSHHRKAEKAGCGTVFPSRIDTIPTKIKDDLPKVIKLDKKPNNVRVDEPDYVDIKFGLNLFSRNSILNILSQANDVASSLGKHFNALTTDDFPCDYFYPGFMEKPAVRKEDHEDAFKDMMRRLKSKKKYSHVTTIWAEDCKALMRYASLGAKKIDVLIPAGFSKVHYDRIYGYLVAEFPDVECVLLDIASESDLLSMTSDQFVERYNLERNSLFIINYCPQFLHLRTSFVDFFCAFLDLDSVGDYVEYSIPFSIEECDANRDFFSMYCLENYPECVKSGNFSLYDPVKSVAVSYAQHGCYIDRIFDSSLFEGDDYLVESIQSYIGRSTTSKLKVMYHVGDGVVENLNYNTSLQEASTNVSYMDVSGAVLYLPSISYISLRTTDGGDLLIGDETLDGLPPDREVFVCADIEGHPKILDVVFSRKDFFDRRGLIPEVYRVPFSILPLWEYSYAVFPSSFKVVPTYFVHDIGGNEHEVEFQQYVIPFVGWNADLGVPVSDEKVYSYVSPFRFDKFEHARARYYEFESQYALLRSNFIVGDDFVLEMPQSSSIDVIDREVMYQELQEHAPSLVESVMAYYIRYEDSGNYANLDDYVEMLED